MAVFPRTPAAKAGAPVYASSERAGQCFDPGNRNNRAQKCRLPAMPAARAQKSDGRRAGADSMRAPQEPQSDLSEIRVMSVIEGRRRQRARRPRQPAASSAKVGPLGRHGIGSTAVPRYPAVSQRAGPGRLNQDGGCRQVPGGPHWACYRVEMGLAGTHSGAGRTVGMPPGKKLTGRLADKPATDIRPSVSGFVFLNDGRRNTAPLADLLAPLARPLANFRAPFTAGPGTRLTTPRTTTHAPRVRDVTAEDVVQFLRMCGTYVDLVWSAVNGEGNSLVALDLAIVREVTNHRDHGPLNHPAAFH